MLLGLSKAKSMKNSTQNFDNGDEEEKDPNYKSFLKNLRPNGHSYMVRSQRKCSPLFIKYENDESSDKELNLEYKKKLRNLGERNNQIPNKCGHKFPKPAEEAENTSQRPLRSERAEYVKDSGEKKLPDPDFATFKQGVQVMNGDMIYKDLGSTIVYEREDEVVTCKKEYDDDYDDDWANEVEIIDSATFHDMGNSSYPMAGANNSSSFRRELVDVLRKPYDEKEYEKLLFDVEHCKAVMRHIDLRHGRERSHPTEKFGKSYLDHHHGFRRKLSNLKGDKPKSLNLLRGFFFWLEKSSHEKSFEPWFDEECLGIIPGSE